MKNVIVILIILLTLQDSITGQSDCAWEWMPTPLLSSESDTGEIENVRKMEIDIALFADHDFQNGNDYRLLIEQSIDGKRATFIIDDVNVLKNAQVNYCKTQTLFNDTCKSKPYNELYLCMVKSQHVAEFCEYDTGCGVLKTKCGPMYFDLNVLLDSARKIEIEGVEEIISSQTELIDRLNELQNTKDVLLIDTFTNFIGGRMEFIYFDEEDKVSQILKDSFWLDLINEKMSEHYESPSEEGLDIVTLDKIGEILQRLIELESDGGAFFVTRWKRINNMVNKYHIELVFMDKSHPPVLMVPSTTTEVSEYRLSYFLEK